MKEGMPQLTKTPESLIAERTEHEPKLNVLREQMLSGELNGAEISFAFPDAKTAPAWMKEYKTDGTSGDTKIAACCSVYHNDEDKPRTPGVKAKDHALEAFTAAGYACAISLDMEELMGDRGREVMLYYLFEKV